jgi:outer membrane protein TolC
MPNLPKELEDLQLANEHIAQAEAKIAHMLSLIEQERAAGFPTDDAERAVQVSKRALVQFHRHRDLIIVQIGDIESGRLPST